jgi:hypothetical protein
MWTMEDRTYAPSIIASNADYIPGISISFQLGSRKELPYQYRNDGKRQGPNLH